jgi:hypothetical protein
MRYALVVYRDETAVPGTEADQLEVLNTFARQLGDRLLSATRLRPTATATKVQVREGGLIVADGPFAETKEQVGGFFVVECADLDEAIETAALLPVARYVTIEVRPVWEM